MQIKIIGREFEIQTLERFYHSQSSEFLAIYGRRRVGKTYLIRNYFSEKKDNIFFNATGMKDGVMHEQIENFTEAIADTFLYKGAKLEVGKNWRKTFKILHDNINSAPLDKKITLFFDEFPWMVTKNSKLLQTLEYFWNHYWSKDNRIKLIICGSSSGWILKNIINNKGGLYNRVTKTIHLEPFNLHDTKCLLAHNGIKLNHKQITEIYMVIGGIPFYIVQAEKGLSAMQIIEKLAFTKNSFLLREFDNLYATLFDDGDIYINIVRTIASKRYGIAQEELFNRIKHVSSGGTMVKKLQNLENAGFIISFRPHLHRKKGIYYKVIDEYTLFYFYWIEPIKNTLLKKALRKGYWEKLHISPAWSSWSGYAFESICYKHLSQISDALKLSPTAIPNAWRYAPLKKSKEKGAQIDLLFDRDDNAITLCEIKYTDKPFQINKQYADNLINKVNIFKTKTRTQKQLFIALISAAGIKKTMYSEELLSGIVTLNDLFTKGE